MARKKKTIILYNVNTSICVYETHAMLYTQGAWLLLWRTRFGRGPSNGRHACTNGRSTRRNCVLEIRGRESIKTKYACAGAVETEDLDDPTSRSARVVKGEDGDDSEARSRDVIMC